MNNTRYQLIKPIVSDKMYETSSLKKASKKCFEEIKSLKIIGLETFTIKNINSNETYTFQIHEPYRYEKQYDQSVMIPTINNIQPINNTNSPISSSLMNLINLNSCPTMQSEHKEQEIREIQGKQLDKVDKIDNNIDKKIEVIVFEIKNMTSRISQLESKLEEKDSQTKNSVCVIS